MAFAQIEPFGCQVEDLRAGIGPALLANIHRGSSDEAMNPFDFFPWEKDAEQEPQSNEELLALMRKRLGNG